MFNPVKLEVESTGVADGVTLIISAPEGRGGSFTVGASHSLTSTRALNKFPQKCILCIQIYHHFEVHNFGTSIRFLFLWLTAAETLFA